VSCLHWNVIVVVVRVMFTGRLGKTVIIFDASLLIDFYCTFFSYYSSSLFTITQEIKKPSTTLISINRLPFPRNETLPLVDYKSDNRY
jgi:hypothetical protein